MEIKILPVFKNAKNYIDEVTQCNSDILSSWQKYMINPFWSDITQWAPFDISYMKPIPIQNIDTLKEQSKILLQLSLEELHSKFIKITTMLPQSDDDPLLVALYPICDSNREVKERQNGVVGSCAFGNIIININPLANNYYDWISYVFAHEYHHCVWGHNWYSIRNGQGLYGNFLEYMLNEGQADLFAESLFPQLHPQWNRFSNSESEEILWEKFKSILFSTDQQIHRKFMFGDKAENLPWCIGYVFGRLIISDYMQKNPNISFIDLINITAIDILNGSRFKVNTRQ